MSVIASYDLSGGRIEPYCSLDEVKFSATASGIDFTNLIENGSQSVQDRALHELVVRASTMADQYVYGLPYGSLCATVNTENGRYYMNRMGELVIHPSFTPILAVNSVSVGWGPGSNMTAVTLSPQNLSIERDQFILTSNSVFGLTQFGFSATFGPAWGSGSQLYCQWSYVNGYANSFTTAASNSGTSSVTLVDPTGIYPSMYLTIWDGQNDEYVQVASNYVPGTAVVTLASPLVYTHGIGVNVSALPPTVKQAVIHFVVGMVKQRGQGGLVLSELGEPTAVHASTQTSPEDMMAGYDLLDEYKAIWGRN